MMARVQAWLADAEWMTPKRARAYALIFAAATLLMTFAGVLLSIGGIDPTGKPLGTDFTSFWAAARLAVSGEAAAVYDAARHAAAERAIFDGQDRGYAAFFYPPLFLLCLLPLGLLPYLPALAVWLVATGLACWRVIDRILPGRGWIMLAYPATFLNIGHGQNAFLTTALFGGGVLAMASRPVLAGLCFGALAFKPQLGLLIPVLLLATGRWRVIAVAAATVGALVLLSSALFGVESWRGFLAGSVAARAALDENLVGYEKMASLFAGLRLLGASTLLAYAGQAVLALVALAAVIGSRRFDAGAQGAVLIVASCMATPFLLDYDLMLLAVPMAWLVARGQAGGFLPWDKTILMAAFLLPLLARPVATGLGLPLAPPVLLLLLAAVFGRGRSEGRN